MITKFIGTQCRRLAESEWTSFSPTTVRPTLVLMHLAAVSAFWFRPNLTDLVLFFAFYLLTGFGITIGFHRLLTHKGFVCPRPLTWALAFLGTAALQGGPVWWAGVHRRHHQTGDTAHDPHSPLRSLWHGHMGWLFEKDGLRAYPNLSKDLSRDKFLSWLDRGANSGVPWLLTAIVCYLIGGLSGVIWGAVVRTVFVWHATWCVNSVCHLWGSRPHQTREHSGNVWWVGLWALGEGWHNHHHAHPRAALHTTRWWEIDPSGYVIKFLEKLGLAQKIVRVRPRAEEIAAEELTSRTPV